MPNSQIIEFEDGSTVEGTPVGLAGYFGNPSNNTDSEDEE